MAKPLTLLYFAALSDTLGVREEQFELPEDVHKVRQLQAHLSSRGPNWQALSDTKVLCAVNQNLVNGDSPIAPGDEVAFFPPVTGG